MASSVEIPPSNSTVTVSIIHANAWVNKIPCSSFFNPAYIGLDTFDICSYSFLISHENGPRKRHVLFDLGIRKDWESYSPFLAQRLKDWGAEVKVGQHVAENLQEHGFNLRDAEAIILSHIHWDHVGNPATFPLSTKLIVGPGIVREFMPGWPTASKSPLRGVDIAGREVLSLETHDFKSKVGGFRALDYFGDGSFYILNAPGHAIGHLNALARTTSNPDTFILLAADSVHLGGELRPTSLLPLPAAVDIPGMGCRPCYTKELLHIHPLQSATKPFLRLDPSFPTDLESAEKTVELLKAFDADERFLIIFSHDTSIFDILQYYPKTANGWKAKCWKERGRWTFLADIKKAVTKAQMGIK